MAVDLGALDTSYLALFVGLRANALVLEHLDARGFADIKESDGYVVQHLVEGPRTITELARRLGVSQQAASKSVADLKKRRLITVGASADGRARAVRLSERGLAVVAEARKARLAIERRVSRACAGDELDATRKTLTSILEVLGGVNSVRDRRVPRPRA